MKARFRSSSSFVALPKGHVPWIQIHRLDRPFKNRLHDDGDVKRVGPLDNIGAMEADMNIQNPVANADNLEADEQRVIHAGAQQHVEFGFDGMVLMPGRAKLSHGRGKC
jgi:hypothetical protein